MFKVNLFCCQRKKELKYNSRSDQILVYLLPEVDTFSESPKVGKNEREMLFFNDFFFFLL